MNVASKEETRDTQFRQVPAAMCVLPYVLYVAELWIDLVLLQDDAYERGVPASPYIGPVWQGFGSSKNGSGSGSYGGVAFMMELKPFWKTFGKTASHVGLRM
jgi:hypothetical protein